MLAHVHAQTHAHAARHFHMHAYAHAARHFHVRAHAHAARHFHMQASTAAHAATQHTPASKATKRTPRTLSACSIMRAGDRGRPAEGEAVRGRPKLRGRSAPGLDVGLEEEGCRG